MIRTEWQGDAARFGTEGLPLFAYDAERERANALGNAAADVLIARSEFIVRHRQIAMANRETWNRGIRKSVAFTMFNRARRALDRAEAALAALQPAKH